MRNYVTAEGNVFMREVVSGDFLTDRWVQGLGVMVDKAEGSLQLAQEYMTRKLSGWHVKQWTDRKMLSLVSLMEKQSDGATFLRTLLTANDCSTQNECWLQ